MGGRRAAAAAAIVKEFMNGPAKELMKKDPGSRCDAELLAVLEQAFELSCLIWTQPQYLKCLYLENLEDLKYSCQHEYLQTHSMQGDDDTKLYGYGIRIVVSPLILVFGDSNYENYGDHIVWSKAVVWL